jgi:MFS transporter/cyclic nucleotide-binding protein
VPAGAPSSALIAVGDVLHNGAIRRIEIAWTAGMAADGAFLVILLVVAYQAGGAVAAGVLGAVRVVPSIISAPFAPSLVVRFRGDRVLAAINVVRALGAIAAAAVVAFGLPAELIYVLAAVVAGAGSLVRAIQTALLPAFARSPHELVAANVASSMGEGLGTFIGPLLAGVLLATTGSVSASVLVAATFAGAAAALTGIRFERSVDARGGIAPESKRPRISEAPSVLRRYPTALVVTGDFAIQCLVRGLLVTLIVVGSIELLDMGDSGVGLLTASIGIGGLAGALGALGLKGGRDLGRVFVFALAAWGLPLALIGAVPAPVVALAALFVVGGSNAVLDVSGFTLLQRCVRDEDRVTVFAASESLWASGVLVGSLLAPVLVALFGPRGAFLAAGAILPALALLTWRPIVGGSSVRDAAQTHLDLLRRNPLFAPLPLTALDRLAESLSPVSFVPGDLVMREGDPGDHYLLIADGEVEVSADGRHRRTCSAGDGVGEIALLRRVPRTATVVAKTAVSGFAIDASTFLSAVSGPACAAAAEAVAASRLGELQVPDPAR